MLLCNLNNTSRTSALSIYWLYVKKGQLTERGVQVRTDGQIESKLQYGCPTSHKAWLRTDLPPIPTNRLPSLILAQLQATGP